MSLLTIIPRRVNEREEACFTGEGCSRQNQPTFVLNKKEGVFPRYVDARHGDPADARPLVFGDFHGEIRLSIRNRFREPLGSDDDPIARRVMENASLKLETQCLPKELVVSLPIQNVDEAARNHPDAADREDDHGTGESELERRPTRRYRPNNAEQPPDEEGQGCSLKQIERVKSEPEECRFACDLVKLEHPERMMIRKT